MSNQQQLFIRYAVAGLAGTSLHFFLLFALLDIAHPVPASTIGAVAGAILGFQLARRWVFRGYRNGQTTFPKFIFISAAGLGVNAAIVSLMVLSMPVFTSQVIATACVLITGYVLNDIWSFRERARQ